MAPSSPTIVTPKGSYISCQSHGVKHSLANVHRVPHEILLRNSVPEPGECAGQAKKTGHWFTTHWLQVSHCLAIL